MKNSLKTVFCGVVFAASNVRQDRHKIWQSLVEAPLHIGVASVLQASINVLYPVALLETTSARALMLISANPLWTAVLGSAVLKERMAWPTITALSIALGAIALVFVPSIVSGNNDGEGAIHGDVIALITGEIAHK